ncbi:MAG: hypothetical protein A2821_03245 [Candidatus Magasanikbacteria bacterium RIFCSPHIGHO2_01_FULL_41_23]|uniref:Cell division protein FtsL n=1 Tax=Candidatus Magasanikbacteria bacterium RIFCSPLOWO2_01_FULL_40_15 TaxID=1798686 RepID=A0A1F6N227_9BACT|nr:MAG: hypothetical protein A2821_03245 [Candidatus Magasanikbacteria bacterium RIFCSPHIGHO2_01_FULL_41_23]OGH76471.1 MAG: hypothetical protein A3F22_03235 [Candidatus Magasanikbacteria bacterium RIFCSPHIGHO2_12_FULL_41_16]OGH77957.1 MAG: hypothetical protein A2983_01270 [Candidatus Magasanikbacteria bacterium RIFCSPLOWO2_01_FULL_40_15]
MKTASQPVWERVFLSRWFLLLLLGVSTIIAISYARAYYEDYTIRREISRLQDEVKKLEKKKFTSLELLQYAQSEHFFDDKARTELNLKKPGEQVLAIRGITPNNSVDSVQNPVAGRVDELPLNNPRKWWYYFVEHKLPAVK